jgi:hypothetical protein
MCGKFINGKRCLYCGASAGSNYEKRVLASLDEDSDGGLDDAVDGTSDFNNEMSGYGNQPNNYTQNDYTQNNYNPNTQGYSPVQNQSFKNTCAILGFIFSLIGFNGPGLVLSIIGIVKANSNGGKGKGLAVAGIVLSVIWTIVALAVYAYVMMNIYSNIIY